MCNKVLRELKEDWSKRKLHKKCWLEETKLQEMKNLIELRKLEKNIL